MLSNKQTVHVLMQLDFRLDLRSVNTVQVCVCNPGSSARNIHKTSGKFHCCNTAFLMHMLLLLFLYCL